jgi:hypothetical protein
MRRNVFACSVIAASLALLPCAASGAEREPKCQELYDESLEHIGLVHNLTRILGGELSKAQGQHDSVGMVALMNEIEKRYSQLDHYLDEMNLRAKSVCNNPGQFEADLLSAALAATNRD